MGLCIARQSESGERSEIVIDDQNLLDKLLGYPNDAEFPMLSSIDRYGDTVFNRLQIGRLLSEWATLKSKVTTQAEEDILVAVERLGQGALEDVHQYLVFVGD